MINKTPYFNEIIFCTQCSRGQSYVNYLNPHFVTSAMYNFMMFGKDSKNHAGVVRNELNLYYGDEDDFSIFTYDNRELTFKTGTANLNT